MTAASKNGVEKEEGGPLIARRRTLQQKPPSALLTFLFTREKGEFCGRTPRSWLEITIFYIIFYTILAAFWIACLSIFLGTLDRKVPRFYGKGSIRGIHPGVGYQPWLKEKPDSTLIKFNVRDHRTYKPFVDQLTGYLDKYNDANETRECNDPDDSNWQASGDEYVPACQFKLDLFKKAGCSPEDHFGYKSGKPCVIITLNRLIGWEPFAYSSESVPEAVRDRYRSDSIAINCDGTNLIDKEHIGNLTYVPPHGIEGKYFPYSVLPNYHQPIAMVKFESLPTNKLVFVECRAYAGNIQHDITQKLGLIHFEVFVQSKAVKGLKASLNTDGVSSQ
ncbi:unnamed protein product, partial [Mesorhabditis belari]|uniref:Sodium/potassium-transporting ATPase subunit beta-3 n=1 Tax=Mesorhabditis belari TaxID=2138241 RepID=A0AAF3FEZ7_9BILA